MPPVRAAASTPPKDAEPADETAVGATNTPKPAAAAAQLGPDAQLEPEPANWLYTWPDPTQYPHIPLTAYPARPAEGDVAARDATVFAFATPPDARWQPTDLPVNQAADNQPPLAAKEA